MSNRRRKQNKRVYSAVYMFLITGAILLGLLITIIIFHLQGYDTFSEWKNRNKKQEIAKDLTPIPTNFSNVDSSEMSTPSSDINMEPTLTKEPTKEPTPEPTKDPRIILSISGEPQEIDLTKLENLIFLGQEEIDAQIRTKVQEFETQKETIEYESYLVENYFSVVFRKIENVNGQETEFLLPLVYDLTQQKQVTGSSFIKETYFAVIKERLQSVVAELFPEQASSAFVSYEQPYQVEDYEQFYVTEESLVFYFNETSLTETEHSPFTYETELSEAKAFLYFKLDGTVNGNGIRQLDPKAKMVALTYDDGPYPKVEEKLLTLFEKYNARATFFFVGNRITGSYKTTVKNLFDAGHEIASHSYSHVDMKRAKSQVIWPEVNKTNLTIAQVTGYAPDYIRLPYGNKKDYLDNLPFPMINWNLDTLDWQDKDKNIISQRVQTEVKDGAIILLHSIHQTTYDATELFLPWLIEQGYEVVTISELFYYKGVTPENGVQYYFVK